MPLKPGKKNIGKNIKEMEESGHSPEQSKAAALHEALDKKKAKKKSAKKPAKKHEKGHVSAERIKKYGDKMKKKG